MAERERFPVYPGWETVRKIDNGSFGAVYEIRRELFGVIEKAALKHISIPQNENDVEELYSCGYDEASIKSHYESYLADIVREYQLMSEMKGHTNVVYCDDIRCSEKKGSLGWDVYIKMELLTPLMKALDQVSEEEQIIRLGKELCGALSLCRSRSIIHRDIKPQNIFLSRDGDFKLGDFGIAKTVEKTAGGTKIGTYSYMAPEVYNNQPYGHEADIYSLGLVLYWLLNDRRLPFFPAPPAVPKASDMDQARLRRFRGDPLPPPAHGSDELKKIVLKACAFDPKDRYGSAEEMLQDLEKLEDGAAVRSAERNEDKTAEIIYPLPPSEAVPLPFDQTSEADRTVSVFSQRGKEQEQGSTADAPRKRKKGLLIAVACAAVALLCVLLFALLPRNSGKTESLSGGVSSDAAAKTGTEADTIRGGTYDIVVWVSDTAVDLTKKQIEAFNHSNDYGLTFHAAVLTVEEGLAAETMLADIKGGGDLYCFAQDQFARLLRAGALDPIDASSAATVVNSNTRGTVLAASSGSSLYAYPLTADNGYFMYYDKSVIPESDITSLERLIEDCNNAGRTFAFQATSAWYMASFFFATGCSSEWTADSSGQFIAVSDSFNSTQGLAAAKGLRELVTSPAFLNSSLAYEFDHGAAVVVSGTWDYISAKDILGEDLGVAELPFFTVDGRSYHLASFSGCKLMGVKPQENADRRAALHVLAQYLTGEQGQKERFQALGWGPSNIVLKNSAEVKADPALTALLAQSAYAVPQGYIHGGWWEIATDLAEEIKNAAGDSDIQAALARYQARINALVS